MVDELGMEREPVAEISTPMEDRISRLKDLTAQATSRYSLKDYNAAAELYAHATELQAEINGEMSSDNSNLLYAYGRCLYHVAVNNSDVLGPRVAGEKPKEGPKKSPRKEALGYAEESGEKTNRSAGEATAGIDKENIGPIELQDVSKQANKPYFQFTGDENFDTSDEDAEDEETDGAEEDADEEDDFANAYEVLDMARILTHQKIKEVEVSNGKGKSKGDLPDIRHLQELLADTYDLQAEISLEGERFSNAATDLKSALELKYSIYPPESSILAEAHYKLALALEFSSVIQQRDENGDIDSGKEVQVDYQLREEAAVEMQEAIASCNARIRKERENLHDRSKANEDVALTKELAKDIQEVEEMVEEMGQRLTELRQPPSLIGDSTGPGTVDGTNPLAGILRNILGESPAAQKERIEEVTKGAKDLTKLVKKKKAPASGMSTTAVVDSSLKSEKRKADVLEEEGAEAGGKTPRR